MRTYLKALTGVCEKVFCPEYTRLVPRADSPLWSISWDMKEIHDIAKRLEVKLLPSRMAPWVQRQGIFFGSHFDLLLNENWFAGENRLGAAYFHGKPGDGVDEFDACFNRLKARHDQVSCLQVSCKGMQDVVLQSGIAPEKVHLIPIGLNPSFFSRQTEVLRVASREKYGVPEDSFVVGSFQKDGEGWGEGLIPKSVKGPDIFVRTIEMLKGRIPSLFVLLCGPARGYVKKELERIGVPYAHHFLENYPEVGNLFHALDVYVVASREEGGPKAILESMASGIPLVSTPVGQAVDLIEDGKNAWLVEPDDVDGLAARCMETYERRGQLDEMVESGLQTAAANTYEAQKPLWRQLLGSLVEVPS